MTTEAEYAIVSAAVATLNVALASLVLRTEPRTRLNVAVAVLFVGNAFRPLMDALEHAGLAAATEPLMRLAPLEDASTVAALLIIPLLWRRGGAWGPLDRAAVGLAAGSAVAYGAVGLLDPAVMRTPLGFWAFYVPLHVAVPLGTLVFLDALLGARSRFRASQAAFFLAAYVLAAFTSFSTLPAAWLDPAEAAVLRALELAVWAAAAAVPLALASAGVRRALARRRGRAAASAPHPTLAEAALVRAAIPVGLLLRGVDMPSLGFLLVRPMLFAYGIFRFKLLGEDRLERATVGAVVVSALLALYVSAGGLLEASGVGPVAASAVPLFLAALVGALLSWPVLRDVLATAPPDLAGRGREVYRAALEESVRAAAGPDAAVLRRLRGTLGIGEREHALMEVEARAAAGRPAPASGEGARVLGRYVLLRRLGEGGFGEAYLAHDAQLDRDVVLKIARRPGEAASESLIREARALARLRHRGVVQVFDAERVGEDVVLVLEFVPGETLAARLARGPLPLAEGLAVADRLLDALAAVHDAGLVHRDVKPENVVMSPGGGVTLVDFGIAAPEAGSGTASGFSLGGSHPGSTRYMSPEQVRGLPLDGTSDLYALAATLHEALTGRAYLDFRGRTDFEVRLAILEEEPVWPSELPDDVADPLLAALSKRPDARPASARELARRLAAASSSAGAPADRAT